MRKLTLLACLLTLLLAVSGCATTSNARPVCPVPQPVSKEVMQPVAADFLTRMQIFLFGSPAAPTPPPGN